MYVKIGKISPEPSMLRVTIERLGDLQYEHVQGWSRIIRVSGIDRLQARENTLPLTSCDGALILPTVIDD